MMPIQIKKMQEKIQAVAVTALAPGELEGGRRAKPAIWDTDTASLKVSIKGTLLKMKDESWSWVGLQRGLVEKDTGPVLVVQTVGGGKEQGGDWLQQNVDSALLGVLCVSGAAGANAKLTYQNMPASIMPVTSGDSFKELSVIVDGVTTVKPIAEALSMLGLMEKMQPWGGGDTPLVLRLAPPLPTAADISAARISAQALVGGGAWGLSRAAKLAGMGWTIDPTSDVEVEEAAAMLAALARDARLAPALASAHAVKPPTAGEAAAEDSATMEAVAAERAQLGELLDKMTPEVMGEVAASAAQMRTDGVWQGGASVGTLLATVLSRAPEPEKETPKSARIRALEEKLAAAEIAAPAKRALGFGETIVVDADAAGGGADAVGATLLTAAPARASFIPAAEAATDELQIMRRLGGSAIVRSLARLAPVPITMAADDPLANLEGDGGAAVAANALHDLASIAQALPAHLQPPAGRPADWAAAVMRLHSMLRAVERGATAPAANEGGGGATGQGGGGRKPPPGSSLAVATTTEKTKAESVLRATAAPVLAPIATVEAVWQARAGTPVYGDAIAEARRVLDELQARAAAQGTAFKAYTCSNGMAAGAMAGNGSSSRVQLG